MTLQARLTLWSMLVMASIVTVVSLSDLVGEFTRQFDYSLERAKLILHYTPKLINREVEQSNESSLTDAIAKSESLSAELFNLAVSSQSVDEIVVTDTTGHVLVDSYPNQTYHPRPDFADLVQHQHWWNKWWVLYRTHDSYEIKEDEVDPQTSKRAITVHVLLLPALIRNSVAPILRDHAWVAIFSIIFGVLGAFAFASIAFHPLGKLGKMLDLVASGEYELQQVTPSADEFGVVASKVSLLGQQLRGKQSEFSDLKGNFERLLDEMEDAVLIFGRDRRLIAAAGAVETFLSRSRPELVGQTVNEVFPAATTTGLLIAQAMQLGRPVRNRAVPVTVEKDGASRLKVVLLAVEFLEESGMLVRLRDPEATRQIGRQLQTADRISAISRLTGGVAHEVKNPLNAILMHVEVAKLKLAAGDYDLSQQMDVLSSEIMRLDRVVKTFLDFTRPVQLNLTEVSLADFVVELAELARPQAEAINIEVSVEAPQEPVSITIDQDLFKQAVLNIVVNAIEAMPEGGQLRFRAGVHGDQAEIRISDTGPGIPADVRDQIYNLYFTTKETGSGIGLSMTFRIVQLHEGTIDLESDPGHGTTFCLRVPLAVLNG